MATKEYDKTFYMPLIFNLDRTSLIVKQNIRDPSKFSPLYFSHDGNNPFDIQVLSHIKLLNKDLDVKSFSSRLMLSINHLEKLFECGVVRVDTYLDGFILPEGYTWFNFKSNFIPNNIDPLLFWLIPLCSDIFVVGSGFNQIIVSRTLDL